MFVIRDDIANKDNIIPNEGELYSWWTFAASDEISWNELLRRLKDGDKVKLIWYTVSNYSPSNFNSSKKEKVCTHPNKYKNVLSRSLIFWVCPDCKKDLGNG